MQRNPSLLQRGPASAPLFLIHDGGGTTFAYHCLGPLNRTVYAIHNPRFYTGRSWPGGIAQMAEIYAHLITATVPRGKILLGGWSLGGLISLEIANVLRNSPVEVVGIVMLDTLFPRALQNCPVAVTPQSPPVGDRCKPEIRLLVLNMIKLSSKMADEWDLPRAWSRPPSRPVLLWGDGALATRCQSSDNLSLDKSTLSFRSSRSGWSTPGTPMTEPSPDCSDDEDGQLADSSPAWPQVILLRCDDYVPLDADAEPGAVARVDALRDRALLGWEECGQDLINVVLRIPSNHFNLFDGDNIFSTQRALTAACDMIDRRIEYPVDCL